MAENKKSFLLYCDIVHTVKKLNDEQSGKLFKIILSYVNDENPCVDDMLLDLVFEPIKQQLKRDLKHWESVTEKRKESGRIGGLKSGEIRKNEANEANALTVKQNEANEAVIVTVNDNVSVNVNDTVNVNKKEKNKEKFDLFRLAYPGTKRGLNIEYENFLKKSKPEDIDLLIPSLNNEIRHKKKLTESKSFCPEWKNLSTWINQKCWTQEFPEIKEYERPNTVILPRY